MEEKKDLFKNLVVNYDKELKDKIKKYHGKMIELWKDKLFLEVEAIGEAALEEIPSEPQGEGDKRISDIYLLTASAKAEIDAEQPEIKKYAVKAIQFNRQNKAAMWLIRKLNSKFSLNSKYMSVEVAGNFIAPIKKELPVETPFLTIYACVAENPEEAMEYIKEIEREEIVDSLELREHKIIKPEPELPKGVYETNPLYGFPPQEDEEEKSSID